MSYGKNYKFTFLNDSVTQIFEQERNRWTLERIERDETWTVNGNQVINTEWDDGRYEYSIYEDANADGIYQQVYEGYNAPAVLTPTTDTETVIDTVIMYSPEMYRFDIVNGSITAIYEIENGRLKRDDIDWDEVWSLQGSEIVKTETERGMVEVETYSDIDGDGLYSVSARSYTAIDGTVINWNQDFSRLHDDDDWQGDERDDYYAGGVGNDNLDSGLGHDNLWGGDGNDSLTGNDGDDYLDGGLGDDLLYSGIGQDTVIAGDGNDLIIGGDGAGNDQYEGGVGTDTVKYTSALSGIRVNLQTGTANSRQADKANIGNDVLSGIENIISGAFNDFLTGNSANNEIKAGAGNDTIIGGAGRDLLSGEAGKDIFKVLSVNESMASLTLRDKILDFQRGQDKIDLSAIDARTGNTLNDSFSFVNASALSIKNANGAVWFSNGVLNASTDRDLAAEIQIELSGIKTFSAADIIL